MLPAAFSGFDLLNPQSLQNYFGEAQSL